MKALLTMSGLLAAIALAALVYWTEAPAQTAPAPPRARLGVHVTEPQKQMGVVGLNEQIHGTFTLVNDTDQPITLGEPMKSCSCVAAEVDRRELAPGERCSLTFAINTGSRRVPRAETIVAQYTTDAGEPRQVLARVLFVPKGVFEVEPAEVELTRAQPKASFVVRGNPAAERHSVIDVRSNHRCVKVDTRALPTVTLELDLDTPDESILNTECIVYTDNPVENAIRVPVRVRKE